MSDPPRRSSRLGGVVNTVEKEDPPMDDSEALAQRAIDAARLAQLASGQGTPANLYPDPLLPLTGDPLTSTTKDGVEHSSAEPLAPRSPQSNGRLPPGQAVRCMMADRLRRRGAVGFWGLAVGKFLGASLSKARRR